MREYLKLAAHLAATAVVLPSVISFRVRRLIVGADRAITGSTQMWGLVPGMTGEYLRRAFLCRTLPRCARTAAIEFGAVFSSAQAEIGERAYIGPRCHIGFAAIGADALLAAGVHVPSGARTHGTGDPDAPIRSQPGEKQMVRIGAGAWIGSAAVVMADVGRDTVVGAGAVVTRPLPDRVVAGGVPARVLKLRDAQQVASA